MINVTKAFLPSFEEYTSTLKRAWDKVWLTNNGELLQELEQKLKAQLDVPNLYFTSNGTIVLQMALKAFDITKEVITTPFSYVATANAILWEGCSPVFVDIDPSTFCIDADKIEEAITEDTQAILATHVYGLPCPIEKIEAIAKKYNLKVIYDAAHAFGCTYGGKSLLDYGDISTCSFHATKLFHTVEGGCIICKDDDVNQKIYLFRQFGHIGDEYYSEGINAKNSEFHAAMGLVVLPQLPAIIAARKAICEQYTDLLQDYVGLPNYQIEGFEFNYAYFPVVFESEEMLLEVKELLQKNGIHPRRYFYPSLNTLPHIPHKQSCPVAEDISLRVLCLPLYYDLKPEEVELIAGLVVQCVAKKLIVQK
jgi:dTDP-4-amino-4,6-dideoxygalactose transaminase